MLSCQRGKAFYYTLLLIFFTVALPIYGKTTVAVLPFENKTGKSSLQFLSSTLTAETAAVFSSNKNIALVERERLDAVLKEVELSQTGIFSGDTSSFELLNADFFIAGQYTGSTEDLRVSIRLITTADGEVKSIQNITGNLEQAIAGIKRVSTNFSAIASGAAVGRVTIETIPSGATVVIDGIEYSKTPLVDQTMLAGNYRATLARKGYQVARQSFSVEASQSKNVTVNLIPERKALEFFLSPVASAFILKTDEADYALAYGLLIGSRIQHYMIGFEYSYMSSLDHSYFYKVPYNTYEEKRYYSGHHLGFLGIYNLFEPGMSTIGFGLKASTHFIKDYLGTNGDNREQLLSKALYSVTPLVYFEFLSESMFSGFIRAGYQYGLNSIDRKIKTEAALSGILKEQTSPLSLTGITITLGMKFNFQTE